MPSGAHRGRGAVTNPPFGSSARSRQSVRRRLGHADRRNRGAGEARHHADQSTPAEVGDRLEQFAFDLGSRPSGQSRTRGREHGCVYCYARPTHAYLGYSPGLDFETKLIFKPEVGALLEKELSKSGYVPKVMALGSNTDPYQPVERTLKLTRSVLEVYFWISSIIRVGIVTKSAGVLGARWISWYRRYGET